jgi:hypothetical protein
MKTNQLHSIDVFVLDNALMNIVYVVKEGQLKSNTNSNEIIHRVLQKTKEETFSKEIIGKLLSSKHKIEEIQLIFGCKGNKIVYMDRDNNC